MPYLTAAGEIKALIAKFTQAKTLWVDTEVADYKTQNPRLSLIQILADPQDMAGANTYLLDVLDRPELIETFINQIMINPEIEKVFHNANYDLKFLGKDRASNVTCTLRLAKKIPYYILPLPNLQLKTLAEALCHITVDKDEQGGDWSPRPLTEKQLHYAILDPVYLAQVHRRLLEIFRQIHPDPATEDLAELAEQYQVAESYWKPFDTEITEIKDRVKAALQTQNLTEGSHFKIANSTILKVDFAILAQLVQTQEIELNFPVNLTKEIQKQLGKKIDEQLLPIEETSSFRLSVSSPQKRKTTKKKSPDPATEDVTALGKRYQEIWSEWKLLDSEIEHLKDRVKKAMMVQNISELSNFKLSNSSTRSVDFVNLVKITASQGIKLNFPVTLTQEIRKQLGEALEKISEQIEPVTSSRLITQIAEDEEEELSEP